MNGKQTAVKTSVLIGAAFTFMTGWFGGGWASGQLALKYAGRWGWVGLFGPLIGAVFITMVAMWICIEYCRLNDVWNYGDFMERFYGHKVFKIIFDIIQYITLPISFSGMMATFSSTLCNYVGGNYWVWNVLFAVIVIACVMWGTQVLNRISTVMGLGILALLIIFFGFTIGKGYGSNVGEILSNKTIFATDSVWEALSGSATSLYMLTAGMALSVMPCFEAVQTRKDVTKTCLFALLFSGIFLFVCSFNVLSFMPEAGEQEVPLLYAAQTMKNKVLIVVYVIVVLLAVVSTGSAMCTGYSRRFMAFNFVEKMKASDTVKMVVISFIIIAVSMFIAAFGITKIFFAGFDFISRLNAPMVSIGVPVVGIIKLVQIKRRGLSLERGSLANIGSWSMFKKEAKESE